MVDLGLDQEAGLLETLDGLLVLLDLDIEVAHVVLDHPQGLDILDLLEYLVGLGIVDQNLLYFLGTIELFVQVLIDLGQFLKGLLDLIDLFTHYLFVYALFLGG